MAYPRNGGSTSEGRRRGGGGRRALNPIDLDSPPVPPCGACKFLRRKCATDCIFAPYFTSDQGSASFAVVHKIFGASNVSKLLLHMPANRRQDAVITICYEAQARLADPVYGCVSTIIALQQQVASLQAEIATVQTQLMSTRHVVGNTLHNTTEPPPPQLPLGQLQPQHNHQSLPIEMTAMLQQQPTFSTNSSTSNSNNNLINGFNNPSFDFMVASNNGASPSPNFGFSGRQSLELEDDEDIANFADDMFRHRR